MARGHLDTTNIDFPPNLDANYVRGLQNARGVSFANVLTAIDQRLAAAASVLDPLVAALISFTTGATLDGSTPSAFTLEEENEYGLPRPEQAPKRGHMLALRRYAKMIGFTEQGLEEMTEAEMLRQVDNFLLTFQRGAVINALTRLFSDDEVYVDRNTTAVSPGFAGSGTGENAFTGTYPDGTALPGGFTLYLREASANRSAALKAQRDRLKKFHVGPFDLVASPTETDAIMALPEFVKAESDLILRAQGTAAANVDSQRYVGVFDNDVRVWVGRNELGTSANGALFKTYGDFDPRNPLVWRYDERFGRGIEVKYRDFYPLANAVMRQRYGINVGNRVGAAPYSIAGSGGYVEPTIA